MERFLKLLDEKGIKDKVLTAFQNNPDINIGDLIEYELLQDEDLEDCFLEEAHTEAINTVVSAILAEDMKQFFQNSKELKKKISDKVWGLSDKNKNNKNPALKQSADKGCYVLA